MSERISLILYYIVLGLLLLVLIALLFCVGLLLVHCFRENIKTGFFVLFFLVVLIAGPIYFVKKDENELPLP